MKRVFIVHGWQGHPNECWFPWLKQELESRGYLVSVPQMPDPETPVREAWVSTLAAAVGHADEETYFVGHSLGVQTILRYLENIEVRSPLFAKEGAGGVVGGVVSVAGFFELSPGSIGTAEDEAIAKPWLETIEDLVQVRNRIKKIIAIFSDNDQYVPLTNVQFFQDQLGAETVVLHERGHFGHRDHAEVVPEILEALKRIENGELRTEN